MENIGAIENKIKTIRGMQVMFDRDLAILYDVENRVLNQTVSRNIVRFPEEFCFKLNNEKFENWKSQIVISNSDKMGLRKPSNVFTEQGVAILASVIKSSTAINLSIAIMRAFVAMRKMIVGIFANDKSM